MRGEQPRGAQGDDRSFGRRPLTTNSAAGVLQLIVDHFAGIPSAQRSTRNTARSWQLIRRDLAFYPRGSDGNPTGALAPHPDLLFALRLITNPPETALPTRPFAVHRDQ